MIFVFGGGGDDDEGDFGRKERERERQAGNKLRISLGVQLKCKHVQQNLM